MFFDKQTILDHIHNLHGPDKAQEAAQQLPDEVDHEQHADLLQQHGVNPQDLMDKFGGAQGSGGLADQAQGALGGGQGEAGGVTDNLRQQGEGFLGGGNKPPGEA
ncbi:MAG: hypothetical protein M3Y62_08705 [Candidatus Dormibacteraeota bacterium]|nr:hypothetical protein [Candidatus Dormibacteraeota bacterium]